MAAQAPSWERSVRTGFGIGCGLFIAAVTIGVALIVFLIGFFVMAGPPPR